MAITVIPSSITTNVIHILIDIVTVGCITAICTRSRPKPACWCSDTLQFQTDILIECLLS